MNFLPITGRKLFEYNISIAFEIYIPIGEEFSLYNSGVNFNNLTQMIVWERINYVIFSPPFFSKYFT